MFNVLSCIFLFSIGRGAIGAYGPEKKTTLAKTLDQNDQTHPQDKTDQAKSETKWKKNASTTASIPKNKKTRYYYRSVDDVIEKGMRPGALRTPASISELSKVKVIDMTGPQQRVLSGYHALAGPKAPPGVELFEDVVHKKCANFALPEIQHNLDLLVDLCEQDIIRIDRDTRHLQDRSVALHQETLSLGDILRKEQKQVDTLENVVSTVMGLMDETRGLSLGQVVDVFRDLQERYYEEYCMYELGELAPGLVGPLITSALASWMPLAAPGMYLDVFRQWKELLEKPKKRGTMESRGMQGMLPYDGLVWNTWIPVLRTTVRYFCFVFYCKLTFSLSKSII